MVTKAQAESALQQFFGYSTLPNLQGKEAHLLLAALLAYLIDTDGSGGGGVQYDAGDSPSPVRGTALFAKVANLDNLPVYEEGDLQPPSIDFNGAFLANVGAIIESSLANVAVTSTNITYAFSSAIDLRNYNSISIIPNVTTANGTTAFYKVQWSPDAVTFWWDETLDSNGSPSGGEILITQDTMIRSFISSTTGYKTNSSYTSNKRARFIRIGQRSDSSVSVATNYVYQRF